MQDLLLLQFEISLKAHNFAMADLANYAVVALLYTYNISRHGCLLL